VQRRGDLFYIPEGWYHGIVNLDDVVAASFQNTTYAEG
jgi:dTDP-4-dehydrorhamnose 3,5-epimerase-like enzyme